MSINDIDAKILEKIQAMQENDFTRTVLKPLYESFGFEKVEFYGGSYEKGKDLLCWKRDSWGDIELTVVQAKKYKPTGKAADKKSLGEMVIQICQAATTPMPYLDGNYYKPVLVNIITPFAIDTRVLETAFFGYDSVKNYKFKAIDGSYIVKMMRSNLSHLVNKLIGSGPLINDIMSRSLHNIDLRNALNTYKLKELSEVYCDLDFTVGNITTKILLSFELKPKNINISFDNDNWLLFKTLFDELKRDLNVDILLTSVADIEHKYNNIIKSNNKQILKYNKLKSKLDDIGLNNLIMSISSLSIQDDDSDIQDIGINLRNLGKEYISKEKKNRKDYIKYEKSIESELGELRNLSDSITNNKLLKALENYDKARLEYKNLENELVEIEKGIQQAKYQVAINGTNVCNSIADKQVKLKELIVDLTKNKRTPSSIISFIADCETILRGTEKLLSNEHLAESAGLPRDKRYVSTTNFNRINFSIHEIFDSGQDFVVFGEAGAGKTTTLQFYARRKIENNEKEIVLYVPLARSFHKLNVVDAIELDHVEYLLKAIVNHLATQDINIDLSTIKDMARTNSSLFIFDGIDEVIDKVPWIINAISGFKKQYPKTQILTSSRLSGKYISKIPFIGLSLMPFDDEQRDNFISSWFNDPVKLNNISTHLKNTPELNEIVRNPLLATILCVIAEYDVPLPESEIRLYEERMSLFLGFYDLQKQTVRLKSHHKDLLNISKKTAYILHIKEIRYASKEVIVQTLKDYYQTRISLEKITLAVNELINPCNILMPMTDDGQFGFGHLRFQEYLAACELKENRSIYLLQYIRSAFWRGAFVLFAKMSDDIYHIIDEVVAGGKVLNYIDTIDAMLKVRPSHEQENLYEILKHNIHQDRFDHYKYDTFI